MVFKSDKKIINEKIDSVTKFVIGSEEYHAYYERENRGYRR